MGMHVNAARHHEPSRSVDYLGGIFHRQRVSDSRDASSRKAKVTRERIVRCDYDSILNYCIETHPDLWYRRYNVRSRRNSVFGRQNDNLNPFETAWRRSSDQIYTGQAVGAYASSRSSAE